MKTPSARLSHTSSPHLTSRDEQILRSLYQYRYMTAEDIAYLHFSPTSLAYVRKVLSKLSGGADLQHNTYLCRFQLPQAGRGNSDKVYTLGIKGRHFLEREAGVSVDWYFRPSKYRDLGFSHLRHALLVTRVGVAAQHWSRKQPDFTVQQTRLSYDLARIPSLKVIPDIWVLFENRQGKKIPIMIEIDRGMEFQDKFKHHVKARLDFIRSGEYAHVFGTPAVIISYATTGQRPEYREKRRITMATWAMEVLQELELKASWAGIFRFTSLMLDEVYELGIFEKPVWYRPDAASPVPLLLP